MEWVIIVDDDAMNLESASHVLVESGIRVTALRSGRALLDFLRRDADAAPDLILLDINMPDMDGVETLNRLREQEAGKAAVPVIFLSADMKQESEVRGLQVGAMDYIRKPLAPDVLLSRVQNALRTQEMLHQFEQEARIDSMTGFLNKNTVEERVKALCRMETGLLCVLDLDSFKLVNDLYGHDMGDRVLILFADLLKKNKRTEDVCGRIGGDEFLLFARNMKTESELLHFTQRINEDYLLMLKKLMGDALRFPAGISIGAAAVPAHGRDYAALFHLADQALNNVKHSGKHNCALYGSSGIGQEDARGELTLDSVTMILEERNVSSNAMWMGREAFINIYRYMHRYLERYHGEAYRALLTVNITSDSVGKKERADIMVLFRHLMQQSLRNSDVMFDVSENQIFLLLPQIHGTGIDVVIDRLMNRWNQSKYRDRASITWETGQVPLAVQETAVPDEKKEDWVAVVDDDAGMRLLAEKLLGAHGIRVSALRSGAELMDFLRVNHPDLILLDVMMPQMDGFETLRRLKAGASESRHIPVIFLTADETGESEKLGLQLGAEDFLRKPIIPDVLMLRVRHTIDRVRLQRDLSREVARKTEENQKLFVNVVSALANAIDAKDAYTNGHSDRVATYARQIARRFGYDEKQLEDIYMMGLLHDVGKIGVPDAIINKPARLTDEEYAVIKTHPVTGARILQAINEMPSLAIGARWHHERFDGRGYPDGLSGENIPEEARIIAVADAYDAMTSRRSYRADMPQAAVRAEIERGAGSQFDPRFAKIMLDMIDEDIDYRMRE